jgi:starch phosphorylase
MKFAMNGALTLGTLDGANIEMREAISPQFFFHFGYTAPEIAVLRGRYDPRAVLEAYPEIAEVVGLLADGSLSPEDPGLFLPIHQALVAGGDRYFVLADLPGWLEAQDRVDRLYADPEEWQRWVLHNIAAMGPFSSDRAVRQYAADIWNLRPVWP